MTNVELSDSKPPAYVSEIFPLTLVQSPNIFRFRLTSSINENTKEIDNRLSFHLSRKFPDVVVTWDQGDFIALAKPGKQMPDKSEWREVLEAIRTDIKDLSDSQWGMQEVRLSENTSLAPVVISQLACQVLQTNRCLSPIPVPLPSKVSQQVSVTREAKVSSEKIDLKNQLTPALSISVRSSILYKGNLADFFLNHPFRQNPEELLVGLHVQDIENSGHGIIQEIVGTVGEKREELIKWATGSTSKQALQEAPDDQPVVGIKFGKNPKLYEYAMAALRPRITSETEDRFEVQYGQLLSATKISFEERKNLLSKYKEEASQTLETFGFKLERSLNSVDYGSLFWYPQTPIDQTPLLFGKSYIGKQKEILQGIKNGGVYRRHPDYISRPIIIAALRLREFPVKLLLNEVENYLKKYGFQSQFVDKKSVTLSDNETRARVDLEKLLDEIAALGPDIVLIFLPEDDRTADKKDGGSFYQLAYNRLLRRQIATQFIYEDTVRKVDSRQILNQVIPGILAKLGNLPFILAEPMEIADYFIGLDVSRLPKSKLAGTMNACASIRLYGRQGEFIRYLLEDGLSEGEEIPKRMLERLLPAAELDGKTILIYRDGRFCGKEVTNILERVKAINAKSILVECIKSGAPRLYHSHQKNLAPPKTGLALRLSSKEALLVTTTVPVKVGLARPLRLRIHDESYPTTIEQIVETTLKLTLLHHGALQTPRLPMPLYGADRMAYLKINGIYPSISESDRQFWL